MQNIDNTRSEEMRQRMEVLREKGLCFFCQEGQQLFSKVYHLETEFWYVTDNDAPLEGVVTYVMAVPRRHVIMPEELTTEETEELFRVVLPWVMKNLNMRGMTVFFRIGESKITGATLHHLHVHLVQGVERLDRNHPPIWAVVGFKSNYCLE